MQKEGIDVLILTHQQKYSYVAGTFHNDFNLGNCLFVWAKEEPTLLRWMRIPCRGPLKNLFLWGIHAKGNFSINLNNNIEAQKPLSIKCGN
jgi:hypothetical protein